MSEPISNKNWKEKHPMQKCTFCVDRIADGKFPICVSACITRAIDMGKREEINKKYPNKVSTVIGFPSDKYASDGKTKLDIPTEPSIFFKHSR